VNNDFWLQDSFLETHNAPTTDDVSEELHLSACLPVPRIVGEHPSYQFEVGDCVAVVSNDTDPFWLAEVNDVQDEEIHFTYFVHTPFSKKVNQRMKWILDANSTGSCDTLDVLVRFKERCQLFTKTKLLKGSARSKIVQAVETYNDKLVSPYFK
jgi:hypothetical protein